MKLYLLILSIFLVKIIGLFYYLLLIFIFNFYFHIENRMSFYKDKYNNNLLYKISEKIIIFKKNMLKNVDKSEYFDSTYYYIITSNYMVPVINLYINTELLYLFILDEIFLMFYTLIFSLVNNILTSSIKKKSNIKEIQINKLSDSSLVDSDSDSLSEENNLKNDKNSNSFTDTNLIDRLKKKNNIDELGKNDIDLSETLFSVNILLNKLTSDVSNSKNKDI